VKNAACPVPGCHYVSRFVHRHIYNPGHPPEAHRLCERHDRLYWRLMGMRLQPTLTMLANPPAHETQEEGGSDE
jgi:hypothetical protein